MGMNAKEMKEVIEAGRVVLHNGKLITRVEDVPSAAELAKTDEEIAAAGKSLDEQIAALTAQKKTLDDAAAAKKATDDAAAATKAADEKKAADAAKTNAPAK